MGLPSTSGTQNWAKDPKNLGAGRMDDLQRQIDELRSQRTFVFQPIQIAVPSTNLPTTWGADQVAQELAVPAGYSQAIVAIIATAGASFNGSSGNGLVGVWPGIEGSFDPQLAISTGTPGQGAQSAASPMAQLVTGLMDGQTLRVAAKAYATAGGSLTVAPGSGNAHISGSVIFLR